MNITLTNGQTVDIDDDMYDVDSIHIDDANGNFSMDSLQDYHCPAIVAESYINGQITQAVRQFKQYGLITVRLTRPHAKFRHYRVR